MTLRPYFHTSIDDLEAEFQKRMDDPDGLRALSYELEFRTVQRALRLRERVRETDDDGEVLPLDRTRMAAAFAWLTASLGLAGDLVSPPRFAICSYEYGRNPDPPALLLLNSFYLNDLAAARSLVGAGAATPNLRRYLGVDAPSERKDLLHDASALEAAVAPGTTPLARWPGPERHPLAVQRDVVVHVHDAHAHPAAGARSQRHQPPARDEERAHPVPVARLSHRARDHVVQRRALLRR
ncbi:MAG TPA: hypothetical protein VM890_08775, partial [Longimicrobium sp.]|nr:hypothetical protein [Longimicrobium sp.]